MEEALGGVHLHGEKSLALGAAEINTGCDYLRSLECAGTRGWRPPHINYASVTRDNYQTLEWK